MGAALLRSQLELITGTPLILLEKPAPEAISTGIPEVDALCAGFPRGTLSEITGPLSSGRTSLLLSTLASASLGGESCVLIDACDAFHPASAAHAGMDLNRLLWIRCGHDPEKALKATDLLVQAGGFGIVALDLGDHPGARRISLTSWFRLRRAVEHTPTALLVLEREPHAKTCAALVLQLDRRRAHWQGKLFRGLETQISRRKPLLSLPATFELRAVD